MSCHCQISTAGTFNPIIDYFQYVCFTLLWNGFTILYLQKDVSTSDQAHKRCFSTPP